MLPAPARVQVTLTIECSDGPCPPVTLQIGEVQAALPGAPNPAAPAQTVTLTPTRHPGERIPLQPEAPAWAREQFYATAPDRGQHDIWKRECAERLWRLIAGPTVPLARAWFELDGGLTVPQAPLFPLHTDLCNAIRRLGLRRLVTAALGLAPQDEQRELVPAQFPVGGPFRFFGEGALFQNRALTAEQLARELAEQHGAAVDLAVAQALAAEERRRASWNEAAQGPFLPLSEEEYKAYFSLADAGVDAWTRPDLASCPALDPLRLTADLGLAPGPAAPPRRTPATGAILPEPPAAPAAPPPEEPPHA